MCFFFRKSDKLSQTPFPEDHQSLFPHLLLADADALSVAIDEEARDATVALNMSHLLQLNSSLIPLFHYQ